MVYSALALPLVMGVTLSPSPHSYDRMYGVWTDRCAPAEVEVHAPGLVVVRGALSEGEQRYLAQSMQRLGKRKANGFRDETGKLNAGTGRGRIYDRTRTLPGRFQRLARRTVAAARALDCMMPDCIPSHCLINYYNSAKGLLWHRDIYANDGDGEKPIINLSVGATCTFGVCLPSGRVRKLHLRSGDALLFGGPCRFVKHAVLDVNLNELPEWMAVECGAEPYRLSLTFRDATSVLGREEFFRRFDVSKGWFRQTQRAWRPGSPLIDAPVEGA